MNIEETWTNESQNIEKRSTLVNTSKSQKQSTVKSANLEYSYLLIIRQLKFIICLSFTAIFWRNLLRKYFWHDSSETTCIRMTY